MLAGIAGVAFWSGLAPWIGGLLLIQGALGIVYRTRFLRSRETIPSVGLEVGILRQGMALLQRQKFHAALLEQAARASFDDDPPKQIHKVERLIGALIDRDKPWFYAISRALLVGTQAFLAIEIWRVKHRKSMHRWLHAWGEFEALMALANYGYEHPDHPFPQFLRGRAALESTGLGHPLLPAGTCVRNDIAFNEETRFCVISGSNMAGKSTLLRAIGLNAVLAYAGAPVCAEAMALSHFSICASMAVEDSLLSGTSKFLAEIDRLKHALTAPAEQKPVLFLVDELLSGTNSKDRRIAAELIIKALLRQGAVGAISTHDLALTEIAALADLKGANMHMGSDEDSDPMHFDYLLKPGVAHRSNALAIARLAGVLQ
ncbi:MAG: MutS-related protein [Bryobacteraceae bacterium]